MSGGTLDKINSIEQGPKVIQITETSLPKVVRKHVGFKL